MRALLKCLTTMIMLSLAMLSPACNRSSPTTPPGSGRDNTTTSPSPTEGKTICGDTFFVTSDTHFGVEGISALHTRQITAMNTLAGMRYPSAIGGQVNQPSFVLACGDLTDKGRAEEYREYLRFYCPGGNAMLKYPVYDCTGNHDRMAVPPIVVGETSKKHGGDFYSLNLGQLHIVCLDMYPNAAACKWLTKDLAANPQRPTILFFHYSILGPYSEFWQDEERENFAKTIKGHNIVAIFHGHYHVAGTYKWNGIDVFNPGSVRHAARSFLVVRVSDRKISVALRDWNKGQWLWGVNVPYTSQPTPHPSGR